MLSCDELLVKEYQRHLNDLAKEVPTNREPSSPGPFVNAIEVRSLVQYELLWQFRLLGQYFLDVP